MEVLDEIAAKKLFLDYEGSSFFMDRDGMRPLYLTAKIDASTEAIWLEELKLTWLASLTSPGNWRAVMLLTHHGDFSHLEELIAVEPLGVFWQKCAFLENLLHLIKHYKEVFNSEQYRKAIDQITLLATKLTYRVRAADSKARVQQIIDSASEL